VAVLEANGLDLTACQSVLARQTWRKGRKQKAPGSIPSGRVKECQGRGQANVMYVASSQPPPPVPGRVRERPTVPVERPVLTRNNRQDSYRPARIDRAPEKAAAHWLAVTNRVVWPKPQTARQISSSPDCGRKDTRLIQPAAAPQRPDMSQAG
jgi:hypothetical protein